MAPSSDDEETSAGNEMTARHKAEKKELRARTLAMKKAAKSGNKQKQKETAAECEKLEKEMEERHKKEIADRVAASAPEAPPAPSPAPTGKAPVAIEEDDDTGEILEEEEQSNFYKTVNVSAKAAKRQAKKKETEEKWKKAVKEDKAASKTSDKHYEKELMKKLLADEKFKMVEIAADGDCLYNSISHQLLDDGYEITGKKLRRLCAAYMRDHRDDFEPFIAVDTSEGEPAAPDEEKWDKYLDGVEKLAEAGGVWGGELEINALARHLRKEIMVYKSDGNIKYGEEFSDPKERVIRIVYLRRAYHLGEHYNSTIHA